MSEDKHMPQYPDEPHGEEPHGHRRRRGRFGRRLTRFIIKLLLIVIIVLAVMLGYNYYKERVFDISNPIVSKNELSDETVMEKLTELGDLVTCSFDYNNVREIKSSLQVGNWNIPGTTHTIQLKYSGHIKAGYSVSEISVNVDNEDMIIYVTLPEAKVTDNYIDMDTLTYSEQNNVFNPISGDEITSELETIKAEELDKAINKGLYQTAEGSAQRAINELLSSFSEYTVKFTNNQQ